MAANTVSEAGRSTENDDPTDNAVQKTRAWTGLLVVVFGDVAIAAAASWGIVKSGGTADAQLVSILTSAFTAISTMTTAFFGIRAVSNTAQSAVAGAAQQAASGAAQQAASGAAQQAAGAAGAAQQAAEAAQQAAEAAQQANGAGE
jgi:type IV secretory pathway VirB6-like protein